MPVMNTTQQEQPPQILTSLLTIAALSGRAGRGHGRVSNSTAAHIWRSEGWAARDGLSRADAAAGRVTRVAPEGL